MQARSLVRFRELCLIFAIPEKRWRQRDSGAAAGVSNLGDGIMAVAFPLVVASITRDPLLVASATVVNRMPWLLFALISGAMVDRLDRRRVMVVTDGFRLLSSLSSG
jgi:MFS family permease